MHNDTPRLAVTPAQAARVKAGLLVMFLALAGIGYMAYQVINHHDDERRARHESVQRFVEKVQHGAPPVAPTTSRAALNAEIDQQQAFAHCLDAYRESRSESMEAGMKCLDLLR